MQVKYKRRLKKQGRFFTVATIAAVGLAIGAVGAGLQYDAQQDITKAAKRGEALRKKQLELDATRQRRKEVRNMLLERGRITNAAASQGALGSSGQIGGAGSAESTAASNINEIDKSQEIGSGIFDTNAAQASARGRAALGGAVSGFGSSVQSNAAPISRSANQLFGVG